MVQRPWQEPDKRRLLDHHSFLDCVSANARQNSLLSCVQRVHKRGLKLNEHLSNERNSDKRIADSNACNANERESDQRFTDANADARRADKRESNKRESNERESNERESNEREPNERESNERESNERESNERESVELIAFNWLAQLRQRFHSRIHSAGFDPLSKIAVCVRFSNRKKERHKIELMT
jgi:hypothetical protein